MSQEHVISVGLTLSGQNDTTTEEKVEGVHKDGLAGEIGRYNKQKRCDLCEIAEYGCSEATTSHKESYSALSSNEEPTREAIKGNGFV